MLAQSEARFFQRIFHACDFQRFEKRVRFNFIDVMCDSGRLGLGVAEKLLKDMPGLAACTAFYFNDIDTKALVKLPRELAIEGDVCWLGGSFPRQFDIAASRYGFSNLRKGMLASALGSLYGAILPGGRLVIADIAALTPKGRDGWQEVYDRNLELFVAFGNHKDDYAPLAEELRAAFYEAGFSNVTVDSGERRMLSTIELDGRLRHGAPMLRQMRSTIEDVCRKNPAFKDEFKVSLDGPNAVLQIPRIIVSADR
jgi:SAM-dependent methyltransferase